MASFDGADPFAIWGRARAARRIRYLLLSWKLHVAVSIVLSSHSMQKRLRVAIRAARESRCRAGGRASGDAQVRHRTSSIDAHRKYRRLQEP